MTNKNPSLLEGLNLPESMTGKPAAARRDLSVSMPSFQPSDWSPTQKKAAAGGLAVVAVAMLVGGAWLARAWMPPSMPKTFSDGAEVIKTGRINNLDNLRQEDYKRQVANMWLSLSEDERNKWRADPAWEQISEMLREQKMDDFAKKVARGEEKLPEWGPPPGAPRPEQRPDQRPEPKPEDQKKDAKDPGKSPQGGQPGGGNGNGRGRNAEQRRQAMVGRVTNSIMNKNPQSNGLRGEMMRGRMGGGPRGR